MLEWVQGLGGPQVAAASLWTLAALILLAVVLVLVKLIRSLTFGTFVAGGRNRKTRLAVMDATAVDSHRRLVLIRRDDTEHLLLIGGPTDVVVERELALPHDVDVGLRELPVAALLRALAAPRGLDLVAPERELQVAGVLEDVAGEGHRQVEVHPQLLVRRDVLVRVGVQPTQHVDLLVDLPALGEPVQRLDHPGLDVGEPVQLERA